MIHHLPSFLSFRLFPTEIRHLVWNLSFLQATKSVLNVGFKSANTANSEPCLPVYSLVEQSGALSIILCCKEAYGQWLRMGSVVPSSSLPTVYLSHTVFLFQGSGMLHNLLGAAFGPPENLFRYAKHIAVTITSETLLVDLFASLMGFDSLETITMIIPNQNSKSCRKFDRSEVRNLCRILVQLIDEQGSIEYRPTVDGKIGLLLRGTPPNKKMMAFYSGSSAPQLRLLTPQYSEQDESITAPHGDFQKFSLIKY